MEQFSNIGKLMAVSGLVLFVVGLLLWFSGKSPLLGKLPGDFFLKGKNVSFYFPLATSLLVSAGISLLLYLIRKFF